MSTHKEDTQWSKLNDDTYYINTDTGVLVKTELFSLEGSASISLAFVPDEHVVDGKFKNTIALRNMES
jgi:hypothetical protein